MGGSNFEELVVVKRSGQRVSFDGTKIAVAIKSAFDDISSNYDESDVNKVYFSVLEYISSKYEGRKTISVEDIQDIIETQLQNNKYEDVYNAFNSYRLKRSASREIFEKKQQHKFVKAIEKFSLQSDENNYSYPYKMLNDIGKKVSKEFSKAYLIENKYVRAHEEGYIYINNLNYYSLYIPSKLYLKVDNLSDLDIEQSVHELTNLILKSRNEIIDEVGIAKLDLLLLNSYLNTIKENFKRQIKEYLNVCGFLEYINIEKVFQIIQKNEIIDFDFNLLSDYTKSSVLKNIFREAYKSSINDTKMSTKKALTNMFDVLNNTECIINQSQKILFSINDYNSEISKIYNEVLMENKYESIYTIYKISIADDIKYFKGLIKKQSNIMFSFSEKNVECFLDGELIGDIDFQAEGRAVLSTTTLNLLRIAIMNKDKTRDDFFRDLSDKLDFVKNQMIQRFDLQSSRYKNNLPNLFKYNLLLDSEKVESSQKIRKTLKNGFLNIGIVGLHECVCMLNYIDDVNEVVTFIKDKLKQFTEDNKINFIFTLISNKKIKEGLIALDKSIYGSSIFNDIDSLCSLDIDNNVNFSIKSINDIGMIIDDISKKNIKFLNIRLDKYENWWVSKTNITRFSWYLGMHYFY